MLDLMPLTDVAWCLGAFAVAAVMAHHMIEWTTVRGMIDRPHARRIHVRPTPRGGGLAIMAVASAAAVVMAFRMPTIAGRIAGVSLPAVAVALVGWWDDVAPRPIVVRLAAQIAAAVVTVGLLGPVAGVELATWGYEGLGVAAGAASVVWLVVLTNVFNFLDGTDGLAGITGAVAATCLAIAAEMMGEPALAAIAAALSCACLGFLTCNWEPARIFMGDVGSTGCGFLLAALPLAAAPEHSSVLVSVAAAAAWPLIADAAITLIARLCRKENIFEPHREHLYQRLVLAGWSHRAVAMVYGGLAAGGGLAALSKIAGLP